MALPEMDAICRSCGSHFRAVPTRSFLGFQKLKCPTCSKDVLYPLTSGYRTTYWIIVGLMALAILGNLSEGRIAFPGLLGIAVIIGLVSDARIRKEVAAAMARGKP